MKRDCILRETVLRYVAGSELAAGMYGDRKTEKLYQTIYKFVDNIPPATDVRPIVRGEWLEPDDDYDYLECSVCEERSPNDETWNFCPNCGADMREK